MLKRGLIVFPLSAIITTASAFSGAVALAVSYWLTYPLQLATSLYFIRRHIAFSWKELLDAMSGSAIAAAASAVGPILFAVALKDNEWTHAALLSAGMTAVAGWLLALWVMRHPLFVEALSRENLAATR